MFRAREVGPSLQRPILSVSPFQRRRLKGSWVFPFREHILPLIDEQAFAPFFHPSHGAPNRPVAIVIGILLLKDVFDYTDQEALDHFAFDRRWHIALDLQDANISCCQKTLHNFRVLLRQHHKARHLFEQLTAGLLNLLQVAHQRQRLDSTHCKSNVATRTRLGLLCETIRLFLRRLHRQQAQHFADLPEQLRRRYHTPRGNDSRYDGTTRDLARRRLPVAARDLFRLVDGFGGQPTIAAWPEFAALRRVLAEQCEVLQEVQQPQADDDDVALGAVPVRLRPPKEVPASSLQTPHDPDVSYGKKGQGYEVQVCETFANKSAADPDKPELLTHVEVTPSCHNDIRVTLPILTDLKARGLQPEQLEVDSNFTSSVVVQEARLLGTDVNGPVMGNKDLPKADEVTVGDFQVDVQEPHNSRCPAGQVPSKQTVSAKGRISLAMVATVCATCGLSGKCPAKPARRERVVRTTQEELHSAQRRRYETTTQFQERQAWRAGIEATNSELKRGHGLGKLAVRGRERVQLAVYLKAAACNVKRTVVYLGKQQVAGKKSSRPVHAEGSAHDHAAPTRRGPPTPQEGGRQPGRQHPGP
jgi:hypothetical protein